MNPSAAIRSTTSAYGVPGGTRRATASRIASGVDGTSAPNISTVSPLGGAGKGGGSFGGSTLQPAVAMNARMRAGRMGTFGELAWGRSRILPIEDRVKSARTTHDDEVLEVWRLYFWSYPQPVPWTPINSIPR